MASNAAITALTQVASMTLGAAIALVILLRFGKNRETDGLFAAYGVYGIVVVVAQTFRTTVVARLVESPSLFAALDRYLGAIAAIFLGAGIPLVALGDPLAHLLIGHLGSTATHTARIALLVLWLAAGAQLVSALLAAALAVREEFAVPGGAYVIGGVVSITGVLAFAPLLGIQAVPLALCLGGVTTASVMALRLARLGYRPRPGGLVPDGRSVSRAGLLLWAAVGAVSGQVAYVVTIGFAARLGPGAPTLYTYANFVFILFMAGVAGSMSIVLAPRIAETWDRRPESLHGPMLEVFRAGLMMMLPVVAVVAIAGPVVARVALSARDARTVVDVLLMLSGGLVAGIAVPVPQIAIYTEGRYGTLAAISAAGVAIQFGLCAAVLGLHSLVALAAASLTTGVVLAVVTLVVVFGPETGRALRWIFRETVLVGAVAALVFVPAGAIGFAGGPVVRPIAALAGLAAFVAIGPRVLPRHWELAQRVLGPLSERMRRIRPAAA
jgi:peptidoglycan biosynthesis protein MviN/MurJ (putative lipid II flippase)